MIRPYRIARSGRGLAPRSPGGARPTPLRAGLFGLSVAVLAGLSSACHESLTQVDSRVVAPSTRPALDIAAGLPRLTDLVADETRASGHAVLARWDDSWNAAVNEGTRLRAEIYRSADTRDLAFDTTSVWSAIESVGATITEIEGVALALPPDLSGQLAEARSLLAEAGSARRGGDVTAAVLWLLRSSDALRRTTPRMVALDLVEKAEGALAALGGASSDPSSPGHARAQRLTEWARSAVETGDYEKAIQRAYYACRLLGVDLP